MSVKQETFTKAYPHENLLHKKITQPIPLSHTVKICDILASYDSLLLCLKILPLFMSDPTSPNSSYWGLETLAARARSQLFNVHIIELQSQI
jgi:hypothetical protein